MIKMKWIGWIGAGLLSAAMIPGVGLARTVRASHSRPSTTTRVTSMHHVSAKPQAAKRVAAKSKHSLHARPAVKTSAKRHVSGRKLTSTSHRAAKTSAKPSSSHGRVSSKKLVSSKHTTHKMLAHRPVSKKR